MKSLCGGLTVVKWSLPASTCGISAKINVWLHLQHFRKRNCYILFFANSKKQQHYAFVNIRWCQKKLLPFTHLFTYFVISSQAWILCYCQCLWVRLPWCLGDYFACYHHVNRLKLITKKKSLFITSKTMKKMPITFTKEITKRYNIHKVTSFNSLSFLIKNHVHVQKNGRKLTF